MANNWRGKKASSQHCFSPIRFAIFMQFEYENRFIVHWRGVKFQCAFLSLPLSLNGTVSKMCGFHSIHLSAQKILRRTVFYCNHFSTLYSYIHWWDVKESKYHVIHSERGKTGESRPPKWKVCIRCSNTNKSVEEAHFPFLKNISLNKNKHTFFYVSRIDMLSSCTHASIYETRTCLFAIESVNGQAILSVFVTENAYKWQYVV